MPEFQQNTVQHTLCMPLCGRMIAARKYPNLFPDQDAERIVRELGEDISGKALYRLQYMWMNCLIRQYNLAWEITEYLKTHPKAAVVELGAGLSCLRRQMGNETNPWYCLDMADVIALRETHIPLGEHEHNVACDLNDFSWFDRIDFDPSEGIVFTAGGLFDLGVKSPPTKTAHPTPSQNSTQTSYLRPGSREVQGAITPYSGKNSALHPLPSPVAEKGD